MDLKQIEVNYKDLKETLEEMSQNYLQQEIPIDEKILSNALKSQIQIEHSLVDVGFYIKKYNEIIKSMTEEAFAEEYTRLVTDSYKSFSATEAKQIASSSDKYIQHKKLANKFRSLYEYYKDICDVVETRKYTLKTLSDTLINGVDRHII